VPKSVSVLYGLTGDPRILEAFRDSVNETMLEMEKEIKTRVRAGGKNEDRTTGEMIWGEYIHFTSRPVDGVPDPHLHAHCFVLNTTFDGEENRWKAGQFMELKRDAPYFEARFHSRMARRIMDFGLAVERTRKGWEISNIPASVVQRFSRRTALIEELAKTKGITDAREKSELGAKTRERKQKNLTMDELRREWWSRLADDERSGIVETTERIGRTPIAEHLPSAHTAAKLAIDHCFERKSVVPQRTLLAEAIRRCMGETMPDVAEEAVRNQDIIVGEKDGRRFATTHAVLSEEQRMLDFARSGRGTCRPLGNGGHVFSREWLNDGQRRAVEHVLESTDRVILIRGVAGTGKTTMMSEATEAITAQGKHVFTFAPSAEASRGVLRNEGFSDAETVARLLKDKRLHEKIRDQIIWIDEASLLSSRTTAQVFDLADELDARVILSGDKRQHGPVDRGTALLLLEKEAGLIPAEIKDIKRQRGDYKEAVKMLSEGYTERGFKQLDQLGWIRQFPDAERYKLLASDYVAATKDGKSALIVTPTHLENEWATAEIRSLLRSEGKLGSEQRQFRVLHNANLTTAERADPIHYTPGDVLVFHQNAKKGFQKGDRVVVGHDPLPLDQAERFTTFRPEVLPLSTSDVIRITHNGKTADGLHRLNNGALFTVKNFTAKGDIRLTNGWTIDKDFGHLAHGYATTSQSAQGKTVDRVFVGISSASFAAASREGFYVAASRGREMCQIYCDEKDSLLEAVSHSEDRLSATEFVAMRQCREREKAVVRIGRHGQAERKMDRHNIQRQGVTYER
jgi:conjugative relaxase-like TrwC/TraI family protein